jgi:FkbM family methyltransferase
MDSILRMKQQLLGSPFGRLALSVRDKFEIVRTACLEPEQVGALANDQLATRLGTTLCRPGLTFVDVGAHIGSFVAEVAHNDASIRIVAIEAVPDKAMHLQRKFPFAEVHACAVGEATGNAPFFVNLRAPGLSSLQKAAAGATDIAEITVPIRTLDGIVGPAGIDVMKIDVEGAELGVLRGGAKILDTSRPTIMFESGPPADGALRESKQALHDLLSSHDYATLVPNRVAHNDAGLTSDQFVESHVYPRRTTNYFAVARERRIEIRDRARRILGVAVA